MLMTAMMFVYALFAMVFMVAIPVCIAVYVYRDAQKRGMEPILWALVAVLIPSFIGLIIYLIVRSGHSALRCAKCGASVKENYVVCPQCGVNLQANCPSCGSVVQADWRLCANCGAELPEQKDGLMIVEQSTNNKGLWIVLGVTAGVVLLLFLLLIGVNLVYISPGPMNMTHSVMHGSLSL